MTSKWDSLDDFKNHITCLLAQLTTLSVPEQHEAIKFVQNSLASVNVNNTSYEHPPLTEPFREPAPKRSSRKKILSPKRRKFKSPEIAESNRTAMKSTNSKENSLKIRAKSIDDTNWFTGDSPLTVNQLRSSSAVKTNKAKSSKVVHRDISANNIGKSDIKTDLPKKKGSKAKSRIKSLKTLCVLCGKVNQNFPGLLRHLFDHQGVAKSCIGCKKSFINAIGFEYHKVMKLCSVTLPQDKVMTVNSGTSLDRSALKQIIVCPFCSERFTKFFNLRRHLSRICIPKSNKEEPPAVGNTMTYDHENYFMTCAYCKCSLNVSNLLEHMKEYHNHNCKRCGETFHTTTLLRRHRDVHKDEVHNHSCKKCGDSFYTLALLKSHMENHKEALVPTHHCTICQISFSTRKMIRLHMKDHTSEERKKHRKESGDGPVKKVKCDTCNAHFNNMFSYQRHCRRIHSAKPENVEIVNVIVCEKCGKKVNGDASLQDHIRKSHKELLPCNECPYKASTKNNLERHTRLLHSVIEKRVPCNRCSATFASKTTYKQHLKVVHCAERKFFCKICTIAYKSSFQLKRHMLSHMPATLSCPHCPLAFRRNEHRSRHIAHKHKKQSTKPNSVKIEKHESLKESPNSNSNVDMNIPSDQVFSMIDVQSGELVTLAVTKMPRNSVLSMGGSELLNAETVPVLWNNLEDDTFTIEPLLPSEAHFTQAQTVVGPAYSYIQTNANNQYQPSHMGNPSHLNILVEDKHNTMTSQYLEQTNFAIAKHGPVEYDLNSHTH